MKLLQLNVWLGRVLPQALKLIELEQPDVICLQEASSSDASIEFQRGMFGSLERIIDVSGLPHSYFSETFSFMINDAEVHHGNAVISRFPITDKRTVFVNKEYVPALDIYNLEPNVRNLQIVKLQVDDHILTVANHHGYWDKDPMGNETSVEVMKKVVEELKNVSGPLVMSGDLNVVSESPVMRLFDNYLEDLTAAYAASTTLSVLSPVEKNVACDHVLVSPDIKVGSFTVSERVVSDHKALIVEFTV